MEAKQLRHLMPRNAQDAQAARELVALGPDKLAAVVPEMLRSLKHHDSPVSEAYCEFFARHGERYVANVAAFLGRDTMPEVKRVLLARVMPAWSREAVSECASVLSMLATSPGVLDIDLLSLRLLARHRLAEPQWLLQWLEFKAARLGERSDLLREVTEELAHV